MISLLSISIDNKLDRLIRINKLTGILMYYIKPCPQCNVKLKFPLDKGKLYIHCPNCGEEFLVDPDDSATFKDGTFVFDKKHSKFKEFVSKYLKDFQSVFSFSGKEAKGDYSRKSISLEPPFYTKLWNTIKRKLSPLLKKNQNFSNGKFKESVKRILHPLQIAAMVFLVFFTMNILSNLICQRKVYRVPIEQQKQPIPQKHQFENLSPKI